MQRMITPTQQIECVVKPAGHLEAVRSPLPVRPESVSLCYQRRWRAWGYQTPSLFFTVQASRMQTTIMMRSLPGDIERTL